MAVQSAQQKGFEHPRLLHHGSGKNHQGRCGTDTGKIAYLVCHDFRAGRLDHVIHLRAEHAPDGFVQPSLAVGRCAQLRLLAQGFVRKTGKQGHLAHVLQGDQTRAHAVVDVVGVVGDFVGQVAQLRLQAGLLAQQKACAYPALQVGISRLLRFKGLGIGSGAVLQNAFAGLKAQVQAVVLRVTLLQLVDHPQALQIVLKATPVAHAVVQRILPGVAKGCVTQIMGQRDRLHQVFVQSQRTRHGPTQLGHLQRMRHAGTEQVALVIQKHLGLVDQAAKGAGMDDAVAVALELGAGGRGALRITSATAVGRVASVGREHQAAQQKSITSRTRASGASRITARPGPSISTKVMAPAWAFLSKRIRAR